MKDAPNVFKHPSDLPDLQVKCPICGKPAAKPYKPFCSKRCADIDLNRWLTGVYAVETDETEESDEKN